MGSPTGAPRQGCPRGWRSAARRGRRSVGSDTARARVARGKEREQLWEQRVQLYPPYREYQQKTKREILVVVLEKQPTSS